MKSRKFKTDDAVDVACISVDRRSTHIHAIYFVGYFTFFFVENVPLDILFIYFLLSFLVAP